MTKTALLFPGQGAQYGGMGEDFYKEEPSSRQVFDRASQALGYDLVEKIFSGQDLDKTEITQPAILASSLAIYQALVDRGFSFDALAGLSLGEYSALVAANSLDLDTALRLVRQRGQLMQAAVGPGLGGMTAIIGLELELVEEIVEGLAGELWLANYNCPGQWVVSGRKEALAKAEILAQEKGAKMVSPLPLSAPFHTPLLEPAAQGLKEVLAEVDLRPPARPLYFNRTAQTEDDPAKIKALLVEQVKSPVLFWQTLKALDEAGVDRYVEVGPKKSLKGFVKRSLGKKDMVSVEKTGDLERI